MTIVTLFSLVLLILILLLPHTSGYTTDFLGRRTGWWRSALYSYRYGPGYAHREFTGLRRLQMWLLLILTTVITQLQPELVAWLVEVLRRGA